MENQKANKVEQSEAPVKDLKIKDLKIENPSEVLSEVVEDLDLLGGFDIVANRFPGQTGVWVGKKKIASIGIGVRKWISFHGLAINVNTDLGLFSMIKPCGLDVEMTSISKIKDEAIEMYKVRERIIYHLSKNFQLECLRS